MRLWRARLAVAASTVAAVLVASLSSRAASVKPSDGDDAARRCAAWDVTYAVTAVLRITETPMGAGDGVHAVGPGTLVLRFDGDAPEVHLRAFELRERFAIAPRAVLWNATVVTDAALRVTPDASGAAGGGVLTDHVLRWAGPIRGYRSDGALVCDGSLCGKFGAPPRGRSELHSPPVSVLFQPLRFAEGDAAFEMPYTLVSESRAPRQKTYLALTGREQYRACASRADRGADPRYTKAP